MSFFHKTMRLILKNMLLVKKYGTFQYLKFAAHSEILVSELAELGAVVNQKSGRRPTFVWVYICALRVQYCTLI